MRDAPPRKPTKGANVHFFREENKKVALRRCLTCGKDFWSAGPQNRMCPPCLEASREIDMRSVRWHSPSPD